MTFEVPKSNYDDIQPIAEVVNFMDVPWENISAEIIAAGRSAFTDPQMIRELDMVSWYMNPDSITVLLRKAPLDQIIGYATALPAKDIYSEDPYRVQRNADDKTAYIPLAFIDKAFQGKKLIGQLMLKLENELAVRGYEFIERDALVEHGYADAIHRHYEDRIVFEQLLQTRRGNATYFRIRLQQQSGISQKAV